MEAYFHDLAATLDRFLVGAEVYLCWFSGEISEFVRINRGKVRQPGTVRQYYLGLHLIRGNRHAEKILSLSGRLADDQPELERALSDLRGVLDELPEDPHLLYQDEVCSTRDVRPGSIPEARQVIDQLMLAGHQEGAALDMVGLFATGPVYKGFANSLGQRNWHEISSFNLEWSLYHETDKAVKSSYSGFEWSGTAFAKKMADAVDRLAVLRLPARSLQPGQYRVYLAPAALSEILGVMSWGGFGVKARMTKQSPLLRMADNGARLHDAVTLRENTAEGLAPAFQGEGFMKPASVTLIDRGKLANLLVSPRSAKEYGLLTNGANAAESPEAMDLAPGGLKAENILAALDRGLYVANLWYLNFSDRMACRLTGMTRFATFWVENGRIEAPAGVMRFDESVFRMLGDNLVDLSAERELLISPLAYRERSLESARLPGALVKDFTLTL